jgi:hypothetical protein
VRFKNCSPTGKLIKEQILGDEQARSRLVIHNDISLLKVCHSGLDPESSVFLGSRFRGNDGICSDLWRRIYAVKERIKNFLISAIALRQEASSQRIVQRRTLCQPKNFRSRDTACR